MRWWPAGKRCTGSQYDWQTGMVSAAGMGPRYLDGPAHGVTRAPGHSGMGGLLKLAPQG